MLVARLDTVDTVAQAVGVSACKDPTTDASDEFS